MTWKWLATLTLYAGLSGTMHADTLKYTWYAPSSGTLDGTAFINQTYNDNVVFTMTANSASAVQSGPRSFEITGLMTVSIAGVGTDTITDPITIREQYGYYLDPSHFTVYFGLTDATTGANFNINSRTEGCYYCTAHNDLTGPLLPVYDYGRSSPALGTFNTSQGSLVLSYPYGYYGPNNSSTFQITEAPTAVTPEPSSLVLLGSGALGLVAMVRRRRA